jgi:hypothetical protein
LWLLFRLYSIIPTVNFLFKNMSKRQVIFILGILIFLIPFAGVESGYKLAATSILGLVVAIISYTLKRGIDEDKKPHETPPNSTFIEKSL